jgi:acyl carrier protein
MMEAVTIQSREDIFAHIKRIFVEHFELSEELITLDAHLYHDLDIDSIDAVDLMVALKSTVGEKLDPEVFKQVRTVNDIVDGVFGLMNR